MSAIQDYKAAKAAQFLALQWAEMLGKEYFGGTRSRGGEFGSLRSINLATGDGAPTIYFQEYDGATNYHKMPSEFSKYLEAEIKKQFPELLNRALEALQADVAELARKAADEHASMMRDAGLEA